MTDNNNTLIWVSVISASSAIVGVLATQIITAINTKASDIRKQNFEILKISISKKIDIGEHYYSLCGEYLTVVKTLISNFELSPFMKSEDGKKYLKGLYLKFGDDYSKYDDNKPIHSSIEIYYDVTDYSTSSDITQQIAKIMAQVFEYNTILDNDKSEETFREIAPIAKKNVTQLLDLLKSSVERTEKDMKIVKKEILNLSLLLNK